MKKRIELRKEKTVKQNLWQENSDLLDTINLYRYEISKTPLLKAEEEIMLARTMSEGRQAEKLLRHRSGASDRARLTAAVQRGDKARRKLVQANTRLVISIAKRYRNWGAPFGDLIQEGNLGLIHAADKFDYKRGVRFSTYATWWIRQSVTRAIAEQGRLIRLPVHLWEKVNRTARLERELEQELGREPTMQEIAQKAGTTPRKIAQLAKNAEQPLSLEMPVGEEGERNLGETIADNVAPDPFELASRTVLRDEIGKALSLLTPREGRIVELRFGMGGGGTHTLDEIGDELGFTRERVRQIEVEALRKLRRHNPRLQAYLQN